MDSVSATTSSTASSLASAAATEVDSDLISSDFSMFLKMLTAQLENQDPLNPIESADYAVQLATFSGVEQQAKTNNLLAEMIGQASATDMAGMADWVGRQVRAVAPAAYEGNPVTVSPDPLTGADHADLVVLDSTGRERNRIAIPVSDAAVEWSGVDSAGASVPWGDYTLQVESFDAKGGLMDTTQAQIYAEVLEARTDGSGVQLVLSGGTVVSADSVTAVR